MILIRHLVNSRILVVNFWGVKNYEYFQLCGVLAHLISASFQGQLYFSAALFYSYGYPFCVSVQITLVFFWKQTTHKSLCPVGLAHC